MNSVAKEQIIVWIPAGESALDVREWPTVNLGTPFPIQDEWNKCNTDWNESEFKQQWSIAGRANQPMGEATRRDVTIDQYIPSNPLNPVKKNLE